MLNKTKEAIIIYIVHFHVRSALRLLILMSNMNSITIEKISSPQPPGNSTTTAAEKSKMIKEKKR